MKVGENSSPAFGRRREKGVILKQARACGYFNKAHPQEKLLLEPNLLGLYHSLIDLREGKYSTPASSSQPVSPKGRRELRGTCEVHSPVAQAHQKPETSSGLENTSLPSIPSITKGLFTGGPFTQYIMSNLQQKITSY